MVYGDMSWIAQRLPRIGMLTVACCCGLVPQSAEGQRGRGVTFAPAAQIPSEGLVFRVMRGAEPVGLPQPTVYHYRMADGSSLERFYPRDLWYPSVYLGRWEDASGMALVMGVLGPLPPPFPRDHASRDEYAAAVMESGSHPPETVEELKAWLEMFAGVATRDEPRSFRPGPRLDTILAIDFAHADRRRLGYVFRFTANIHGVDPDQWYVALFELPMGSDADAVARSIEQDFVGSLGTMAKLEDRSARAAVQFQHAALASVPGDRSPAFLESRERAIHSIRGLPGWWFVETPNYVLVSDLRGGRRSFVQQLQEDLEAVRAIYEQMVPPRKAIDAVSLVRVFGDADEYVRYVGDEHRATGGVWMPSKRELIIRPFEWGSELERRARMASIVYHEAFHQYIFYAFDLIRTSPWYNEGHAVFFEGADLRRSELRVDEVPQYVSVMESLAAAGTLPVPRLLMLDYDEFYDRRRGDMAARRANYAMAWGLVYYLRKGAPIEADNRYEEIIGRYEEALWKTRDEVAATRQAFEGVDMRAFSESFTDFWLSERRRHRARRNHDLL